MFAAEPKPADSIDGDRYGAAGIKASWKQIIEPFSPFLEKVTRQLEEEANDFEPTIAQFARYAINNQGKRFRPVLVALCAEASGGVRYPNHVKVANIIEMVHLATLVHDDVIDEASIRRRRPTLAANWGNEISILLGDCLFAHALKLAANEANEVCRKVSQVAGEVCSGEILQCLERQQWELSREKYFQMVEMKTAALFALSCELGVALNQASNGILNGAREFGLTFGRAYQIYDDCLDLVGSEVLVGKSLGTDLAKGKMTLPVLIARDEASQSDRTALLEMLARFQEERPFSDIVNLLHKYDAFSKTRQVIEKELTMARHALTTVANPENRGPLVELTDFLANQTKTLGVD